MKFRIIIALFLFIISGKITMAQHTLSEIGKLKVNEKTTTVITASEPVYFVDISTDLVAGDQPMENTIRLKPKKGTEEHKDGDILSIVTITTERYRVQYALIYTTSMEEAVSDKEICHWETTPYHNPSVSLSTSDMASFSRRIWNSPARYRSISTKSGNMTMRLNNLYTAGDYYFIDFSIDNRTNIKFDIDEIRIKISDKKQTKATVCQMMELKPCFILENIKSFKHGYRNVIVVRKLTFPNDKILSIEIAEKQISGRTIGLSVDYEDIIAADSFDKSLLREK